MASPDILKLILHERGVQGIADNGDKIIVFVSSPRDIPRLEERIKRMFRGEVEFKVVGEIKTL